MNGILSEADFRRIQDTLGRCEAERDRLAAEVKLWEIEDSRRDTEHERLAARVEELESLTNAGTVEEWHKLQARVTELEAALEFAHLKWKAYEAETKRMAALDQEKP